MAGRQQVVIPYNPRPLQRELHAAVAKKRWFAAVTHRRFGKSVWAVNHLIKATLTCKLKDPRFHYIAPTYAMGKQIAWDYMQHFSAPIPNAAPNQSELRIDYPNGGRLRILSADNPDSMRGIYSDGAIFDEYGMHPPKVFTEIMRPALADRGGWAGFLGTPNGKNQFYDVVQQAHADLNEWVCRIHKASETGILNPDELAAARKMMTPDEYAQEFECSFEAAVKGAIYARELEQARADGRITDLPYEPLLPVHTAWDLGIGDTTAIWFFQTSRSGQIRVIDFYEASGEGFQHYANVLNSRGYSYGKHWAPHDIQVKELGSGKSRLETAMSLGIRFQITPNIPIEDGINAARMTLPKCWFDAKKCKVGLESLQHYRRDYNARLNEFKATPVHDFASHASDAFRYLAVSHREQQPKKPVTTPQVSFPQGDGGWMVALLLCSLPFLS